jgi:hypothetical protein
MPSKMNPLNSLTDAELNEVFAVEVAGWTIPSGCTNYRINPDGRKVFFNPMEGDDPVPPFSTSADAVMKYINKFEWDACGGNSDGLFRVAIYRGEEMFTAMDFSFARAACIALIEAKRRAKE